MIVVNTNISICKVLLLNIFIYVFGIPKNPACNMNVDEKTVKHLSENNVNNIGKRSKISKS
jgi:hypothetical protein